MRMSVDSFPIDVMRHYDESVTAADVKRLAWECGFELAGITMAAPHPDADRYLAWAERGLGGAMGYLAGRRATVRADPRNLLPSAQSIICVGKLYNSPWPHSTALADGERAWISRYAWGDDYHDVLRRGLERLVRSMQDHSSFDYKICVDTAPLLERSYAASAGLGWIGKNTCLINQHAGSWFFLGELLVSLALEPGSPVPHRCGTCTRCIDLCPTNAIVPRADGRGEYELDARRCISYFTIELRGSIPEEHRSGIGAHVFGCDICQDVCPWNRREAETLDPAFHPRSEMPPRLDVLARLTERDFCGLFRNSAVARAKYRGFLRNVAIAMGNSKSGRFRKPLETLACHEDPVVSEHARWALRQLDR
jgi:epoxyqueuosine reductase